MSLTKPERVHGRVTSLLKRPLQISRNQKDNVRRLCMVVNASSARTEIALRLSPLDASYEQTHAFSSFSNWILPSHLMVGRYPYVEPGELKKCRTHEAGEAQLKQILEANIRTFVSLQVCLICNR